MSARTRNAYRNCPGRVLQLVRRDEPARRQPVRCRAEGEREGRPAPATPGDDGKPNWCKLLAVARERPLLDALTVRKGPRKGERYADVRPEVRERLELARPGTGA